MSKKEHVWEFGHGEVVVSLDKKAKTCTLMRVAPGRKFNVADDVAKNDCGAHDESRPPVEMKFSTAQSLRVLIQGLQQIELRFHVEQDVKDSAEKDEVLSNSIHEIKKSL